MSRRRGRARECHFVRESDGFALTLIEAMHPTSATMLQSMWYALRSKVSEWVTWLAMISTKKKVMVKNSTRYSWTGCSLLNHSFTAMILRRHVVNAYLLSRRHVYMETNHITSLYYIAGIIPD